MTDPKAVYDAVREWQRARADYVGYEEQDDPRMRFQAAEAALLALDVQEPPPAQRDGQQSLCCPHCGVWFGVWFDNYDGAPHD